MPDLRLVVSVLALTASTALLSTAPSLLAFQNPMVRAAAVNRVVVLGDSLAVSPSRLESFPNHLQQRIDSANLPWTVVNAGVRGETTADGLRRFDTAVPRGTRVLVLELGANDGLRGIDVDRVEGNLARMIERAQSRGIHVLLCGMETPPRSRGWPYTMAFHEVFPRLAAKYKVPLVPFLLAGVALVPEMNGPDTVHPNASGARRIAENVWPVLAPLLRDVSARP